MLEQMLMVALVDTGLLHRDIKLDNILVRPNPADPEAPPTLLLADFGTMATLEPHRTCLRLGRTSDASQSLASDPATSRKASSSTSVAP